ncbi:hypothetical protein IQ07DRAFT_588463 [Pyrenochaeta sp. DS3sAY3a]|nr:hypothetical protein IQ07DRAFT_588463 [Pyrenochaeta sp. DS3sAY3a]
MSGERGYVGRNIFFFLEDTLLSELDSCYGHERELVTSLYFEVSYVQVHAIHCDYYALLRFTWGYLWSSMLELHGIGLSFLEKVSSGPRLIFPKGTTLIYVASVSGISCGIPGRCEHTRWPLARRQKKITIQEQTEDLSAHKLWLNRYMVRTCLRTTGEKDEFPLAVY